MDLLSVALHSVRENLVFCWLVWAWPILKKKKTCFPPFFWGGVLLATDVSTSFLSIIAHLYFHTRHVDMVFQTSGKLLRLLWMYPLFLQALHLFLAQKTSKHSKLKLWQPRSKHHIRPSAEWAPGWSHWSQIQTIPWSWHSADPQNVGVVFTPPSQQLQGWRFVGIPY